MNPRIQKIIDLTGFYFGIPVEKVMSRSKQANYVLPRHVAIVLSFEFVMPNKKALSREFKLDHSTVFSAIDGLENYHALAPHLDYLRHKVTKELDLQLSDKIEEINAN